MSARKSSTATKPKTTKTLADHRLHAHIMTAYSRDYRLRYCKVPRCGYREQWDDARREFRRYDGPAPAAKRRRAGADRAPEPVIAPVSLWTGLELMPA